MDLDTDQDSDSESSSGVMISNLPLLFAKGLPTSLATMTLGDLEAFVPFMVRCSTGEEQMVPWSLLRRPNWWPRKLPFRLPNTKATLEGLVEICYSSHGCEYLLQFCSSLVAQNSPTGYRFNDNRDGTTSMYHGSTGKLLVTFRNENREYDKASNNVSQKRLLLSPSPHHSDRWGPSGKTAMVQPSVTDVYLCDKCENEFVTLVEVKAHEKQCRGDVTNIPKAPSPELDFFDDEKTSSEQVPFLSYLGLSPSVHTGVAPYMSPRKRNHSSPPRQSFGQNYLRYDSIPLCSFLGRYILSNSRFGNKYQLSQHMAMRYERMLHAVPGIDVTQKKERNANRWMLVWREKRDGKVWTHVYCFNKAQRKERTITICTGLDRRSRFLFTRCRPICVSLQRVRKRTIDRLTRLSHSSAVCIDLTDDSASNSARVPKVPEGPKRNGGPLLDPNLWLPFDGGSGCRIVPMGNILPSPTINRMSGPYHHQQLAMPTYPVRGQLGIMRGNSPQLQSPNRLLNPQNLMPRTGAYAPRMPNFVPRMSNVIPMTLRQRGVMTRPFAQYQPGRGVAPSLQFGIGIRLPAMPNVIANFPSSAAAKAVVPPLGIINSSSMIDICTSQGLQSLKSLSSGVELIDIASDEEEAANTVDFPSVGVTNSSTDQSSAGSKNVRSHWSSPRQSHRVRDWTANGCCTFCSGGDQGGLKHSWQSRDNCERHKNGRGNVGRKNISISFNTADLYGEVKEHGRREKIEEKELPKRNSPEKKMLNRKRRIEISENFDTAETNLFVKKKCLKTKVLFNGLMDKMSQCMRQLSNCCMTANPTQDFPTTKFLAAPPNGEIKALRNFNHISTGENSASGNSFLSKKCRKKVKSLNFEMSKLLKDECLELKRLGLERLERRRSARFLAKMGRTRQSMIKFKENKFKLKSKSISTSKSFNFLVKVNKDKRKNIKDEKDDMKVVSKEVGLKKIKGKVANERINVGTYSSIEIESIVKLNLDENSNATEITESISSASIIGSSGSSVKLSSKFDDCSLPLTLLENFIPLSLDVEKMELLHGAKKMHLQPLLSRVDLANSSSAAAAEMSKLDWSEGWEEMSQGILDTWTLKENQMLLSTSILVDKFDDEVISHGLCSNISSADNELEKKLSGNETDDAKEKIKKRSEARSHRSSSVRGLRELKRLAEDEMKDLRRRGFRSPPLLITQVNDKTEDFVSVKACSQSGGDHFNKSQSNKAIFKSQQDKSPVVESQHEKSSVVKSQLENSTAVRSQEVKSPGVKCLSDKAVVKVQSGKAPVFKSSGKSNSDTFVTVRSHSNKSSVDEVCPDKSTVRSVYSCPKNENLSRDVLRLLSDECKGLRQRGFRPEHLLLECYELPSHHTRQRAKYQAGDNMADCGKVVKETHKLAATHDINVQLQVDSYLDTVVSARNSHRQMLRSEEAMCVVNYAVPMIT